MEERKVKTQFGTIVARVKKTPGFKIMEIVRLPNEKRIFALVVSTNGQISVSSGDRQLKILLKDDHKGLGFRGRKGENVAMSTTAGEVLAYLSDWGDDPIPPNGVLGWISLCTNSGPYQIVTLCANEQGDGLVAKVFADENCQSHPYTLPLRLKGEGSNIEGGKRTWTVN